ncbi:protein OSB3, chloroplastic/mitochondrial-like isoform X1 [Papaver somniferum]|uniref:protein OSB3, chloroplastic/mitochondrial-like isoform X1 n=1 Tax=Papaver somniferum TaxID=3469 RepID=UPI000E6FB70A|nr:protein OSB3, chloroplastic/mitochondrial-like isoform X1 [Papaver somniferum]
MNLCKSFALNLSSSQSTVRRLCIALQSSHLFSTSSSSSPSPESELLVSESKDDNNNYKEFSRFEIDHKLQPQKYVGHLDWPKPSEIPWQSNKTNSSNLIGSISMPVQFQDEYPDGKSTVIAILSRDSAPHLRIPIIFKGCLADIAAEHLKEKDVIHVAGHLSGDSLPPKFVKEYGHFGIQVMAHSISFIKVPFQGNQTVQTYTTYTQGGQISRQSVNTLKDTLWRDLFDNPSQWADYRKDKLNGLLKPKHPDFKHKDSGQPLWINSAPKWAISELQITSGKGEESSLSSAQQPIGSGWINSNKKLESTDSRSDFIHKDAHAALRLDSSPTSVLGKLPPPSKPKDESEESWKNLIERPDKWVDIRSEKVNIKEPDFLHKDTGHSLWLSNAPTWVLQKLFPPKRL